jgi:hypothetical protein
VRVAYVGNFIPEWSTENDIRIALESLGHEVVQLQEHKAKPRMVKAIALESDLLLWTTTWDDAQPLPDTLDTLHELGKKGIPSAAYHLDTFWQTSRGGRRWWRNPMFRLQHVFTADGDWDHEYIASGIHHHYLPAGVRHTACEEGTPQRQWICDVAFAGSDGVGYHDEWPYRHMLICELEAMCQRNGWTFRNPGGRQDKIDRPHMADFYASCKVVIGDSLCTKKELSSYWSDRAYEAPGRHAFLIMPELPLLNAPDQYAGNMPMYPWGDWARLEEIIGTYLDNDAARAQVANVNAQNVKMNHTYHSRMATLLEEVM